MRRILTLVIGGLTLLALGCGAGGGTLVGKDTGAVTIRETPKPSYGGYFNPPSPP